MDHLQRQTRPTNEKYPNARRNILLAAVGVPLLGVAFRVEADGGLSSNAVTLSRAVALDGPAGAKGREQEAALQAYFLALNAAGGIHGRKIVLKTANIDLRTDDAMRRLYEEHRPFALFLFGGTPGSVVAMKQAMALKVPFVAPNSGANIFHQPGSKYVFNVRARYQDEVIAAIRHFFLVSQRRIALVHVDDAFGRDAAEGYREGIRVAQATSLYEGRFSGDGADLATHVKALVNAKADTVICVGSSKRVAEIISQSREAGVSAAFMTLSNNASAGFVRELGAHARGVVVSQVSPPPTNRSTQLSRELSQLLSGKKDVEISYAAMEAYVSAKVLVEGLRRVGPNLNREAFVQALESVRHVDLGGIEVDYSATNRTGSRYVELTILTASGKYLR